MQLFGPDAAEARTREAESHKEHADLIFDAEIRRVLLRARS